MGCRLSHGKSKEAVSKNISKLEHGGKPPKQAVAIALNMARESHGSMRKHSPDHGRKVER